MSQYNNIQFNKYYPFALLYFFANSFLLPNGLLYTTLLTPLFLVWLIQKGKLSYIILFFLALAPFSIAHFLNGVNTSFYLKSTALAFSSFVFALAAYQYVRELKTIRSLFKIILQLNFALCILATISLLFVSDKNILWAQHAYSVGVENVKRLQLLTYEPSYYATLLVPIALYYYLKLLLRQLPSPITTTLMLSIPLLLTLSLGVIAGMVISLGLVFLTNTSAFCLKRQLYFYSVVGGVALLVVFTFFFLTFPQNAVVARIINVFTGNDTSFQGRTNEAFELAWQVAGMKSHWWGAGPGQTKELGLQLWRQVYNPAFTINEVAIPNAVADTLAIFGIFGVILRLGLQIGFFFKTQVWSNHYRLALFIFVFVYQFTGSFIYNIAEFLIWILAFSSGFEEFSRKKSQKGLYEDPFYR